jgi:hypothetical protein
MAKETKRNDPCPCNSGKKYKNCCMNVPVISKKNLTKPLIVLGVSGISGALVGYCTDWQTGISVGVACLVITGIIASFVNPPPSSGSGSPGAINFGG